MVMSYFGPPVLQENIAAECPLDFEGELTDQILGDPLAHPVWRQDNTCYNTNTLAQHLNQYNPHYGNYENRWPHSLTREIRPADRSRIFAHANIADNMVINPIIQPPIHPGAAEEEEMEEEEEEHVFTVREQPWFDPQFEAGANSLDSGLLQLRDYALLGAVQSNDVDYAQQLLEGGASANWLHVISYSDGRRNGWELRPTHLILTVIKRANWRADEDMFHLLVQHGADVNRIRTTIRVDVDRTVSSDENPLSVAFRNLDTFFVRALLASGADPTLVVGGAPAHAHLPRVNVDARNHVRERLDEITSMLAEH